VSPLVPLRAGGSKPPLFCVHAQAGHVVLYRDLARLLDDDQPVWGIETQEPLTSFEEAAARYASELRDVQPHGPYTVVGECDGGLLAFELARQLRESGEDIDLLALVDAFGPGRPRLRRLVPHAAYAALHRARILAFQLGRLARLRGAERRAYAAEKAERARLRRTSRDAELRRAFDAALRAYRPRRYDGPLALLRAERMPAGVVPEEDLGWRSVCPTVEVELLPGYFTTPISEPGVRVLAGKLGATVERSRRVVGRT